MRVVHVAPTAFGADGIYGGGERYPLELARAVAAHVDCTLLTFRRGHGRRGEHRERGGLRIETLPAPAHLHHHPAHPVSLQLPRALSSFDVVHAHQVWATPSRTAAVAARLRGRGMAVTDHGLLGPRARPLAHRLVDRFLTVSRYSAQVLGVPGAKTAVIYGGADTDRFTPAPSSCARSGILFVGRLTPHKGVDRLLRALPPGAALTVVGTAGHDPHPPESGYVAELERLASTREGSVRFLGAVADDELLELYRRAVVLALPSVERTCYGKQVRISELLGLTLLEAMACGTPVVASGLGGLREVVRHAETGFLVEPGDEDALRHYLGRLLGDRRLARRLGDNARQRVVEQFTWDACARRCLDAYSGMGQRRA
jgi:glycosyltransferase involved in cell wall biosynthesis